MIKFILIFSFLIVICVSQFLINNTGPCVCDFTANICDIGCCCDSNCTSAQIQSFSCPNNQISPISGGCVPSEILFGNNTSFNIYNDGNQLCIYNDNYALRNFYYAPNAAQLTQYSFTPVSSPVIYSAFNVMGTFGITVNQFGASIYTLEIGAYVGFLAMTQSTANGNCIDGIPIGYLRNQMVICQRVITNITTECINLPGISKYFRPNLLVANFPSAMIGIYNTSLNLNSTGNFTIPTYSCNLVLCVNSSPVLAANACNSVVTSVVITISGESAITAVAIAITTSTVSATYSFSSQVIFNKIGYNTSIPQLSGNPGYINGKPLIASYSNNSISNWLIPSSGNCVNGTLLPILFGFNTESDCSLTIINLSGSANDLINTTLNRLWPRFVAPFGNSMSLTPDWAPVLSENVNMSTGTANSVSLITKQSIYILYARNGTLTSPQNKVIGVKINNAYSDVSANATFVWITVSVTFVDASITPYDVNSAVIRARSRRSVKDFLYLLYVENSASALQEIWKLSFVSYVVFVFASSALLHI